MRILLSKEVWSRFDVSFDLCGVLPHRSSACVCDLLCLSPTAEASVMEHACIDRIRLWQEARRNGALRPCSSNFDLVSGILADLPDACGSGKRRKPNCPEFTSANVPGL